MTSLEQIQDIINFINELSNYDYSTYSFSMFLKFMSYTLVINQSTKFTDIFPWVKFSDDDIIKGNLRIPLYPDSAHDYVYIEIYYDSSGMTENQKYNPQNYLYKSPKWYIASDDFNIGDRSFDSYKEALHWVCKLVYQHKDKISSDVIDFMKSMYTDLDEPILE